MIADAAAGHLGRVCTAGTRLLGIWDAFAQREVRPRSYSRPTVTSASQMPYAFDMPEAFPLSGRVCADRTRLRRGTRLLGIWEAFAQRVVRPRSYSRPTVTFASLMPYAFDMPEAFPLSGRVCADRTRLLGISDAFAPIGRVCWAFRTRLC